MTSSAPAVAHASGSHRRITAAAGDAELTNDPTPPDRAHPVAIAEATWPSAPPATQPEARP
jgi:hypothetical protein